MKVITKFRLYKQRDRDGKYWPLPLINTHDLGSGNYLVLTHKGRKIPFTVSANLDAPLSHIDDITMYVVPCNTTKRMRVWLRNLIKRCPQRDLYNADADVFQYIVKLENMLMWGIDYDA